ncbi:YybH family protein [Psychrobacillus soli]|uniref:Nuclear transport factor 2 family protein n=1 Tax=Psychrobacillus soli TaxID=1543965 RepID=A0A544TKI7_9BACI|nr:nuclear transport factor 2 family protein [Psychrobacillus soli]TQR17950.1 nuclear transport factor 2 family protein [Psychrobacillus soli]
MGYEKALEQYISATNTHDFNNVSKILHEDAIYWFSDKNCTTNSEIQRYFENAWNLIKEEVYSAEDIKWMTKDEKSATCIYAYRYEGYYKGEFVKGSGRATNIFTKEDNGEWKLIHEHLSNL